MKGIGRVIFAAASIVTLTQAGWFGGDEEPVPKGKRGGRPSEDTVEPQPDNYEKGIGDYVDEGLASVKKTFKKYTTPPTPTGIPPKNYKKAASRDEMMSKEYNQKIIRDEQIEDTGSIVDDDGYLSDEEINKIWAEHMHDFVPEDMMNVIVETRTTEALFEEINHKTPTQVKGAYYVLNGNAEKTIDCMVYDPNREIVYKRKGSAQGILLFDTTIPGEYAIIFSNQQSGQDLTVTLALHTYEDKEEQISFDITEDGERIQITKGAAAAGGENQEIDGDTVKKVMGGEENMAATENELANVKRMLREIQTQVKQIQSEAKLSMMRQNGHNEDLLENQDWNFYFMLIEVAAFISIVGFQTHHIKKLLDNKLII